MQACAKRVLLVVTTPLFAMLWAGCPESPTGANSSDSKGGSSTFAPRVETITPNHGPVAGGTRVTIIGGPFESQIGVLFGAHAAVDPTIVNSRMITATAPPQRAGTVDVTVLSDGGQTTILGAFTYEISSIDIISISPRSEERRVGKECRD